MQKMSQRGYFVLICFYFVLVLFCFLKKLYMRYKQVACNLVSIYFDRPQQNFILNFDFLEKGLGIVSPPNFVFDFSRKMFLMLCSIN